MNKAGIHIPGDIKAREQQADPLSFLAVEDLFDQLSSGPQGLSLERASYLAKLFSTLTSKKANWKKPLKLLLRQFTNPLILLLLVAVLLSAALGEYSDSLIIFGILLASGLMGFLQEWKAGKALEKLQGMIRLTHEVIREGRSYEVETDMVFPGDILILNAGDIIPADCRILESVELHVNESAITGESFPAEKMAAVLPANVPMNARNNSLWKGTHVISGTARALVVRTGKDTVLGELASRLEQNPETAFEKGIRQFGYFLLRITVILSIIILSANIYFGKPLFDAVLFSLALAVGMAPELLPAIMTFSMSAGANTMMKKKVIVKKLSSIFNLGEVSILCSDKTGTITEGTVSIGRIVDMNAAADQQLALFAYLNATLQGGFQNPIDTALSSLPISGEGFTKINEVPYDFIRKRLSVAVQSPREKWMICKGAFDNILECCTKLRDINGPRELANTDALHLTSQFTSYCENGYRVLALAYKEITTDRIARDDEKDLIFGGFILLEDPLKSSTLESINRLKKMHVDCKIITGDNRFAATYIARQLGIAEPKVMTGSMLHNMLPEALKAIVLDMDVFAEIEPHQKERIVRAMQLKGKAIAYIGDGINDVAAINAADAGISTNNAVDVAREAADFVLLEKDLSVLADGIREGRKSFVNSMKYIFITTGATFGNMFSVAGASLLLPFLPMLPKQILLTNFITDFPFLTIASDQVEEEELERPRKWDIRMIRHFMISFGIHSSVFDFITFYVLYVHFSLNESAFQTGWFLESVITELMILFIIRTKKPFLASPPGKLLFYSAIITTLFTLWLPISPLAGAFGLSIAHTRQAVAIALILLAYLVTADILKIIFFRYMNRQNKSIGIKSGGA